MNMTSVETEQTRLEAEMVSLGSQRAAKRNRRAFEKEAISRSSGGARLLREVPPLVAQAIRDWTKMSKVRPGPRHAALDRIAQFSPELVAVLGVKVVLDSLSRERSFTKIALTIARRLEDEERYISFKRQSKITFDRALRRTKDYTGYKERRRHLLRAMVDHGLSRPAWTDQELLNVGVVLLDLIITHSGLIESTTIFKRGRREIRIRPTEDAMRWVEDQNQQSELMQPLMLPFFEEPLDWIDPLSGGFHSTSVYHSALVKTKDKSQIDILKKSEIPEVYRSVNALQRTKWRINPVVWELFRHFWEGGYNAEGLPERTSSELPPKPADIATNEEARKAWRKAARKVHDANHRRQAERMYTAKLHWVCQRYLDRPFHFCWQLDWRGRAYPISYYLHPQGGDLVRSLLLFNEGKPVKTPDALRWHKIHGANCWGLDKAPFGERTKWVDDNTEMVLRIANDPLDFRAWEEADEPWQFLAWCLDYADVLQTPDHVSCLPIHQDATQSGIQIYSLLLRDPVGAEATNCIASASPQDLYGRVAARLIERLQERGDEISAKWLKFGIDRACTKRPVMTRVYNATLHSARTYVEEWATLKATEENKPIPSMTDGSSGIWRLTEELWAAMSEIIDSTSKAQDWLTAVARMFGASNKHITWTTPLGFPVRQWYPKFGSRTIRTTIGEKYRQLALRYAKEGACLRRMKAAFAPNYIHSLDASAMMRTVSLATERGVSSMATVHDSYASVAADSQTLAEATRDAYVSLFSGDLLADLRDQLQAQLPGEILPPLPSYGSLDINMLRESPYFFS